MQERKNYHGMTWDAWYDLAQKYYEEHGDLLIPRVYTVGKYKLGRWIERQRAGYNGKVPYSGINAERIRKLDAIGMQWKLEVREDWDTWYRYAKEYYEKYKDLRVPGNYTTEDKHRLGNWIREQRKKKKCGQLSEEQIEKLNEIDMIWTISESTAWARWYQIASEYAREHGNLRVPAGYVTEDGKRLGSWICVQRERRKGKASSPISEGEIAKLDQIGMIWDIKEEWDAKWDDMFAEVQEYVRTHKKLPSGSGIRSESGMPLSYWVSAQKAMMKRGSLRKNRAERLARLLDSI